MTWYFISVSFLSGLQIKVTEVCHYSFTYAWSPVTECPQMIDWISIRKDESASPHIRCYWLRDEKQDELSTLMASIIDSPSTAALIIVNTLMSMLNSFLQMKNVDFQLLWSNTLLEKHWYICETQQRHAGKNGDHFSHYKYSSCWNTAFKRSTTTRTPRLLSMIFFCYNMLCVNGCLCIF